MSQTQKISAILASIRALDVPTFIELADALNMTANELVNVAYKNTVSLAVMDSDRAIQTIKHIRLVTNLGLKESKDIFDRMRSTGMPQVFMENVERERAEFMVREAADDGVNFKIIN